MLSRLALSRKLWTISISKTVKLKIISGGQTGVDRAALDAALKLGVDCGGWCPSNRMDELGTIPAHYPLTELEQGGLAERTLRNVKDSDGTVLVYFGELRGGTQYTVECCKEFQRPHALIDAAKVSVNRAAEMIDEFVREGKISILNLAGPRESEWSQGYDYVLRALDIFLSAITRAQRAKP